MCLQCRSAHLCEYMCHVTLIINKGMCQLPTGDEGNQPALGFRLFRASQRPHSPLRKGAALPQQIFKGGQIGLSSVEQRGHREKSAPTPTHPKHPVVACVLLFARREPEIWPNGKSGWHFSAAMTETVTHTHLAQVT